MATIEIQVPTTKDAPSLARRALDPLEPQLDREDLDDVRLIVSELVSKAVQHSGKVPEETLDVEVTVAPGLVSGSICDIGTWFPGPQPVAEPQGGSAAGFGLFMVEQLSSSWGIEEGTPNCVWFELAC
jgi:anti-sigma regulatory factor (Ser/Thr protein kinase)